MSLTDFLLARIAEDDDAALGLDREAWVGGRWIDFGERYRAECEAKRQIVELHRPFDQSGVIARRTLELLATPYADHPDYRDEWKP